MWINSWLKCGTAHTTHVFSIKMFPHCGPDNMWHFLSTLVFRAGIDMRLQWSNHKSSALSTSVHTLCQHVSRLATCDWISLYMQVSTYVLLGVVEWMNALHTGFNNQWKCSSIWNSKRLVPHINAVGLYRGQRTFYWVFWIKHTAKRMWTHVAQTSSELRLLGSVDLCLKLCLIFK